MSDTITSEQVRRIAERLEEQQECSCGRWAETLYPLADQLDRDAAKLAALRLQKCEKCGHEMPANLIAIEVQDGHPIDDPAGFMWCIVCHGQRVVAELKARLAEAERERDEDANSRLLAALEQAGEAIHSEHCGDHHHAACVAVSAALSLTEVPLVLPDGCAPKPEHVLDGPGFPQPKGFGGVTVKARAEDKETR